MTRQVAKLGVFQDGCNVAPHCGDCPLSECRFVDAGPYKAWKRQSQLVGPILALAATGMKPGDIAQQIGYDIRTVFRVLAQQKEVKT